jgi:hypothetical protein
MRLVAWERVTEWNRTWALAVVFGLASVPWTHAFVAGLHIPLWPSFIASATFYAAGTGLDALVRGYASNAAGVVYAALTLAVVGAFMFLASLHGFVSLLSFTPGGFFGYATMFSVYAAEATAFGIDGLPGETHVPTNRPGHTNPNTLLSATPRTAAKPKWRPVSVAVGTQETR